MHMLQSAFVSYIRREYKCMPRIGKLYRPEEHAMAIRGLGINYDLYIELACGMIHDWSLAQGWKYPYWTAVMCDSSMSRISKLLVLAGDALADGEYNRKFQLELAYAQSYIDWYVGIDNVRPKRNGNVDSNLCIDVALYVCDVYGVECLSSNYNSIAAGIERNLQ